ncbi:MAG: hypothetical protein JWL65_1066 [Gammaproteobacteria bacterium]|nr:hypothetical protein [Gammaproteobacteria bacterium]
MSLLVGLGVLQDAVPQGKQLGFANQRGGW